MTTEMAGVGLHYESVEDGALLRLYHKDGDVRARQALIERHLGFVRRLAQRYAQRGETIEDLTQVGCVGLIKAVDRFDGRHNVALATYAAPNILGEIKRHFRDKGWSVRVPRDVQELNVKLGKVVDQLTTRLGRSPSVEELATATDSSVEQVVEALESSRAYSTLSLSERGGDGDEDGADPLELLGEEDDGYGLVEQRQLLREGFRGLPERERAILHMRFFLGLTQSEIADRVGISQMHVSRLIRQSLERVRADLAAAEPEQAVRNRPCPDGARRRVQPGRKRTTRSRPSA
ncbi:MAG: SigB/SigF/SigG family RNA polymerase sigma factor [Thermoleophilaceae bacterium]